MMNNSELKIVFLGTPEFAVPTLKALIKNDMKPFLVISQPDKPVGRKKILTPSPIKELALANGIEVATPHSKKELTDLFKELDVDVCLLVAYGMIIPIEVLEKPRHGFINVHPSLLPKYRGPSPIQSALLSGDNQTGVTVMKLSVKMDAGPIIIQEKVDIDPEISYPALADQLSRLGADLVIDVLPNYMAGKVDLQEQDDSEATYCRIISRQDGLVDWTKSALAISHQFRAFDPWPGIFTNMGGKRLKIVKMKVLGGDFDPNLTPGEVFLTQNKTLAVKCGQDAISLMSVHPEGKSEVSGKEFINGHKSLVGMILE